MSKRTLIVIAGTLICGLLLSGVALAMSSDNYRLDWFTPLTGSGGTTSSTNYAVSFTVGQSGVGTTSSTSYEACLGYWCAEWEYHIYLPLVLRNFSS
jgi:hypothetical protein